MGRSADFAFRGADRRWGAKTEHPDESRSKRFALLCVVVVVLLLAALPAMSGPLPSKVPGDGVLIAALSALVGLATTGAWLASWAVSGRTWPAYAGLALVPAWLMAEVAATPIGNSANDAAIAVAGLVPGVASVFLLRRARHAPQVDASLRPLRVFWLLLGVLAAVLFGGSLFFQLRGVSVVPAAAVAAGGAVSTVLWCVASDLCRRRHDAGPVERYGMSAAFLALALGSVDRAVGAVTSSDELQSWAMTGARAVCLVGWAMLLTLALSSLAAARAAATGRQQRLRVARDDIARGFSEQARHIEEHRHDLRSLIAGIQGATSTLTRYRDYLDGDEQRLLESALLAEITRLQRSIGAPQPSDTFDLTATIGPVITAERARGTAVHADLPDVEVLGSGDSVAALVQNFVTNARHHAPGSAVTVTGEIEAGSLRLTVDDDGPGLPSAVRQRVTALFADSGAPSPATVPQPRRPGASHTASGGRRSGLGLTICARLASEQGARLRLLDTPRGTSIELTMRLAAHALEPSGVR